MNTKKMNILTEHYDKYFEQTDALVIHSLLEDKYHIDVLIYPPNEKYPFWKLATIGASDYKMPKSSFSVSRHNEYVMFIDPDEDLNDRSILDWYYQNLFFVSRYAYFSRSHITYRHSFEWKNDDPEDEMVGAFIEFPQIIETIDFLRCKLSRFKTVACLQIILLNKDELATLLKIAPYKFDRYLYPEDGSRSHFICERHRSEKF